MHAGARLAETTGFRDKNSQRLKAVCHVSDWPLQSELNTTDFFVNLCI